MNPTSGPNFKSFISLATLAALLVGVAALSRQPAPKSAEPVAVSTSRSVPVQATELDLLLSAPMVEALTPPSPWAFEAATHEAAVGPGAKRPDLLGAPKGWTYDSNQG
jgi:hypothetical protein